MAHYLDPKNDLVFKRIFGEHPDLLISFLNALMPLEAGQKIESIQYLSPEMAPNNPLSKNSIVDVRCIDNRGRQFIVEMQMHWTTAFNSRMIFNASKAYVRQLDKNAPYEMLQPVYCLGILNETFDRQTSSFYHHYQIVNRENTEEIIPGLEFVLVELPKFKAEEWAERRMAVLWLRFLREVKDASREVSEDLLDDATIHQALDICQEGAFTEEELAAYDKYWDVIRTEKTLIGSCRQEGRIEGHIEGRAKGRIEGRAEGHIEGRAEGHIEGRAEGVYEATVKIAKESHKIGFSMENIARITGLTPEEIKGIISDEPLTT
jgi:predicted transposase/invertase (TIGR01784 family)